MADEEKQLVDMLTHMMEIQDILNAKVGVSYAEAKNFDEETLLHWLHGYNSAQICESGEFWKCFGRWWRDRPPDWIEQAREESIDELHFLLTKFILLGMSSRQVYEVYLKKNEKNLIGRGDQWNYRHPDSSFSTDS